MLWFLLFELLGIIAVFVIVAIYCRMRVFPYWNFIWRHKKWVGISLLLVCMLIAILCARPLYRTTQCYFEGVSMHAQTKYSWYMGMCQIRTPSGAYVPLNHTRAVPQGSDQDADYDEYLY